MRLSIFSAGLLCSGGRSSPDGIRIILCLPYAIVHVGFLQRRDLISKIDFKNSWNVTAFQLEILEGKKEMRNSVVLGGGERIKNVRKIAFDRSDPKRIFSTFY